MKPSARRRARECAVQAIYSWQISHNEVLDIELEFLTEQDTKGMDVAYFRELLSGVVLYHTELDQLMSPFLSRPLEDLGEIESAVLRLSTYELSKRQDIPYRVVINEGIELAKIFGADDSHKFVNGVLDKVAQHLNRRK